jgi:NADH-quinone oxidoreductase subunit N
MFFFNFFEYGSAILLLNISIYILLIYLFFNILFIFNFFKTKNLNLLKFFKKFTFVGITVILNLLSMAGIPPLLGFFGKFFLFNFFFLKNHIIFIFVFLTLNMFSIYFYIHNLKFFVNKSGKNNFFFLKNKVFFNKYLLLNIIILNFLNFFGILFFEDMFIYFLNTFFFMKTI